MDLLALILLETSRQAGNSFIKLNECVHKPQKDYRRCLLLQRVICSHFRVISRAGHNASVATYAKDDFMALWFRRESIAIIKCRHRGHVIGNACCPIIRLLFEFEAWLCLEWI